MELPVQSSAVQWSGSSRTRPQRILRKIGHCWRGAKRSIKGYWENTLVGGKFTLNLPPFLNPSSNKDSTQAWPPTQSGWVPTGQWERSKYGLAILNSTYLNSLFSYRVTCANVCICTGHAWRGLQASLVEMS